jgi:ankyrin repeat protein
VGLRIDNFPATQEDQIALSSLASLLAALTTWGYAQEAKILSDVIANFMLYEGASGDGGSHRKVLIAVDSDWLACLVRNRQPCDKTNLAEGSDTEKMSPAFHLNSLMAFGSWKPQNSQTPLGELEFLSDIAAGAYCYLNIVRRGDSTEMQGAFWRRLVEQLSSLVGIVPEVSQSLTERIQVLLNLAALASLCHAATVESLRGTKRLLYNGLLIRHLQFELENNSVEHISHRVLSPLCDMVSTLMRQGIWSQFRDEIVINLLSRTSLFIHDTWSVVNLAVERIRFGAKKIRFDESPVLAACKRVISETTARFNEDRDEIAKLSVERGYTGLLRKCLKNQLLEAFTPINDHYPSEYTPGYVDSLIDRSGNSLMHHGARLGFPDILKVIIECLGMTAAKERVNKANAAGQSATHLACINRAPMDVFRLLWITRVNLNVRCNQGRTPLHYCFPDQNLLPEYHFSLMEMIETHSLPTTIPLDDSKAYGIYGKGQVIDTRAFDFRKIIHQLYCRNTDIRVQDQFGLTALHQAAKEGWGVNLDIFFTHTGGDSERLANDALRIEDNAGCTLLDYARMNAENGGENIILAEMRKRCMAIPQNVKIPAFRTSGRSDC